jgi:hypothetical protein
MIFTLAAFALNLAMGSAHPRHSGAPIARVNYTNYAARTEVVINDLARVTGRKLKASDSVKELPLTVRLKDADVDEALKKIAEAEDGQWINVGPVRTLQLDVDKHQKRIEADVLAAQQNRFRQIQAFLKEVSSPSKVTSTDGQGAAAKDPSLIALAQLIKVIGVEPLCTFDTAYSLVFSNQPHPLEHQLPEVDPSILEALATGVASESRRLSKDFIPKDARILINFQTEQGAVDGMLGANITVLNAQGSILNEGGLYVGSEEGPVAPPDRADSIEPLASNPSALLKIPPLLKEASNDFYRWLEPSPELRKVLMDPYHNHPYMFAGELVSEWAELKDVQLVAQLDEMVAWESLYLARKGFNAGSIQSMLRRSNARLLRTEHSGQWVVVPSSTDLQSTAAVVPPHPTMLDRATALNQLKDSANPSLEEMLTAYRAGFNSLDSNATNRLIFPNLWINELGCLDFIQWYDCLDAGELANLSAGKKVPLVSLSPRAKDYIVRGLFGQSGPSIANNTYSADDQGQVFASRTNQNDPYEMADAPIPTGSYVTYFTKQVPAFRYNAARVPRRKFNTVDIASLAYTFVAGEREFELGTAQQLIFHFHFCGKIEGEVSANIYSFPSGSKILPKDLPADLRAAYDEALTKAQEDREKQQSEDTKGVAP